MTEQQQIQELIEIMKKLAVVITDLNNSLARLQSQVLSLRLRVNTLEYTGGPNDQAST